MYMSGQLVPFVEISPITKVKTIIYTKMQVVVQDLYIGNNSATLKVILWTEMQDEIREFYYSMTLDEYKQWTTDDFILQWVKDKLRFENF
jgi:hypothetical protein